MITTANRIAILTEITAVVTSNNNREITGEGMRTLLNNLIGAIENTVVQDVLPPTKTDRLWLDTSQTPNVLKYYEGTEWIPVTTNTSGFEVGNEYNSDQEAYNDGVPLNSYYKAGSNHKDGVRWGSPIRVNYID